MAFRIRNRSRLRRRGALRLGPELQRRDRLSEQDETQRYGCASGPRPLLHRLLRLRHRSSRAEDAAADTFGTCPTDLSAARVPTAKAASSPWTDRVEQGSRTRLGSAFSAALIVYVRCIGPTTADFSRTCWSRCQTRF